MNILQKFTKSFLDASQGQESFGFVMWFWGGFFYLLGFFIFDDIDKKLKNSFFLTPVLILLASYFVWHIYVAIKCAPKNPKLSKEEQKIVELKKPSLANSLLRKLFLQEPVNKINPRNLIIILDLYFFLHFMSLI
ncbi:MAG: hypothetical protein EBT63_06600 [Proteobacteria bacterium]|nr:hypothetical protein [Pseudomonadota bacterium]NCA27908.1 hypothetical protein [Pseudomonadota bacterium]